MRVWCYVERQGVVPLKFPIRLAVCVVALAFGLTAIFTMLDLLLTNEEVAPGDIFTDFVETLFLSAAMAASAVIVNRLRGLEDVTTDLRVELTEAANAGRAWRAQSEHLFKGLSAAIAVQFDDWGLTDAEADIAALILKGVALKDIAALRKTSEATIRQQAQSIYRKSGLSNRSEFAAYFLEDLFDVAGSHVAMHNTSAPSH